MRYGLSLLVCFALTVGANAQNCVNGQCRPFDNFVIPATKAVIKTAVAAPARIVTGSCCKATVQAQRTGPVRRFLFRR